MRNHILICLFLAGLLFFGFFVDHSDMYKDARQKLQKITVPSPPLQFGKRGYILDLLGLHLLYPKDYSKYIDPATGRFTFKDIISLDSPDAEYKKEWTRHTNIPMDQYPSSLIMDQKAVDKNLPILSVAMDEFDLYDPATGIVPNRHSNGKSWERPCFISYYDKGKLLFATGAGVRIHGYSKKMPKALPLRFYFRVLYGYDQFKPGVLFSDECTPVKQLIARREAHFTSMLALDLAKRIGCLVPEFKPAIVYLNGKQYGDGFVLIEHLNDKWLYSRYGHDRFILLRTTGHKERRDRSPEYQKLLKWANDKTIRMTMEEVGKQIDVDNLCRWFISQFYTAGYDEYQGPAVLDASKPDAKWFWINWDMDGSFRNLAEPEKENIWEQEVCIHNVMMNPPRDRKNLKTARYQNEDPRPILFRRMHQEDPDFKKYFERLYMNVMNHKLSPEYLQAWYERQHRSIVALYPEERTFLETQLHPFINHRSDHLRKLMQRYFGSAESFHCSVEGLETNSAIIDGFKHTGPYQGWYFKDSTITVAIPETTGQRIDYWMVNGSKIASNQYQISCPINSDTTIEPIFKEKAK